MSEAKKTKEGIPRRLDYIITNYRKARRSIDQSRVELNETSRELDEVLNRYGQLSKARLTECQGCLTSSKK